MIKGVFHTDHQSPPSSLTVVPPLHFLLDLIVHNMSDAHEPGADTHTETHRSLEEWLMTKKLYSLCLKINPTASRENQKCQLTLQPPLHLSLIVCTVCVCVYKCQLVYVGLLDCLSVCMLSCTFCNTLHQHWV